MMKASVVTDLQQEEAGTRAMRVGKKIIKISFATISTELPVSLGEKRNANEILICCLGFYGAAFVPRYCSSSPVKGTRCEGRRKRGGEDGPGQRALGLRTATGASGGHSGESLPPWPPGSAPQLEESYRPKPFSSRFLSFFSAADRQSTAEPP